MASSADTPVLTIHRARKRFGRVQALAGVELDVRAGEAVGLLGPNGAGKSTLVKSACGLVRLDDGAIRIGEHAAGSRGARRRIGYLAELFRFPPWLTVDEALRFQQRLARSTGGAAERARLLERVGIAYATDRRVAGLSKGMQQRLGIAQAILGDPALVVLDEPTSALDPAGRAMVRELIGELRADGRAVLVSSHLLAEIEASCTRVVVLVAGEVRLDGAVGEVTEVEGAVVETDRGEERFAGITRAEVPGLVERLVGEGRSIYSVRVARTTLEEAYLELVEGAAS